MISSKCNGFDDRCKQKFGAENVVYHLKEAITCDAFPRSTERGLIEAGCFPTANKPTFELPQRFAAAATIRLRLYCRSNPRSWVRVRQTGGSGMPPPGEMRSLQCPFPSNSMTNNRHGWQERARELGVDPRELAKAAVNDLLTRPADDFDRAAKLVLVTPQRRAHLERTLPAKERHELIKDIKLAPAWMHPIFRELAEEDR